jgi:hypothetical protein
MFNTAPRKLYRQPLAALAVIIFVLAPALTSCHAKPYLRNDNDSASDERIESSFFVVSSANLSAGQFTVVSEGLRILEERTQDPEFLRIIQSKTDWTFPPESGPVSGNAVATCISSKVCNGFSGVQTDLDFYTPPSFGWDICGGFSTPWRPTQSTGCTNATGVHRSSLAAPQSADDVAAFLVHEWLHVVGFGHGDNYNQCDTNKRNSVPIYTACILENLTNPSVSAECSSPC